MTTITFEPEGWDQLGDRLDKAGVQSRIRINEGLRAIGGILVPALKAETPVGASRRLRNSTIFQVLQPSGDEQVLEVRQGARSGTGFFYGRVVRHGRRAGTFPPISALEPWVMAKLGIPAARARAVAFLVARKIYRRGIPPNPYHERALNQARPEIQQQVELMGTRIVAYLSGR